MKSTILNLKKKFFLLDYLCETTVWSTLKHKLVTLFIIITWLSLVIMVSSHHELWRDEVKAFSYATDADSFVDLSHNLKNEGHPILWYSMLRVVNAIIQTPLTLKIVSIVVGFISILLFYLKSPFKVGQKVLFLFGFFPLYEYTVITRNYGISMLFMFLFAVFYSKKKRHPLILALILFLLANTNAHSIMLTGLFLMIWFFEDKFYQIKNLPNKTIIMRVLALLIIGLGIIFSVLQITPDGNSHYNSSVLLYKISSFLKCPSCSFKDIDKVIFLFVFALGLIIKPIRALALSLGLIMFALFYLFVNPITARHQGLLFIFIVALYWMTNGNINKEHNHKRLKLKIFRIINYYILSALFLLSILYSYINIYNSFITLKFNIISLLSTFHNFICFNSKSS